MGTIDAHLVAVDAKNGQSVVERDGGRIRKRVMPSRTRRW